MDIVLFFLLLREKYLLNKTAREILSGQTVDMLGPSSWSSELSVAERFSIMGEEPVNMVFVLPQNRSGVSITHLGFFVHPICFIGIIVAFGMFYSENTKKATHEAEAQKIRDEISRLKQQ